ncbi:MAG: hypothetical protein PHO93_01085 [Candidatus Saccharimonadaceae bacterium]|nr:hypothetical protein [Candidatus Saccharimonadaceae bacterium]
MNEADAKKLIQQIADKIKKSTNILVTVSNNPSVDDLSAALGLTIMLNKLDKHATAIFSGAIPSAITFLEPDKVFEHNADSLRDFIIALDKEKADHLRYKVEGDMVKIFITPYRTTITSDDLEFSQGDFNVDLVMALGVANQDSLDAALAAHGRILHEVTVVTMCAGEQTSRLGAIDWRDETASSLSEMVTILSDSFKTEAKPILDKQVSTALLTGIVAATDRFSNPRTTSRVMTMSAQLMAAGADQQLIAAKLQESHEIDSLPPPAQSEEPVEVKENTEIPPTSEKPSEENENEPMGQSTLPPDEFKINHGPSEQDIADSLKAVAASGISSALPSEPSEVIKEPDVPTVQKSQLPQPEFIGPSDLSSKIAPAYAFEPEREIQPVATSNMSEPEPAPQLHIIPPAETLSPLMQKPTTLPPIVPLVDQLQPDFSTLPPIIMTPTQPAVGSIPQIEKFETVAPSAIIEPSLGGTLNAATHEAADQLRQELESKQNKTILKHSYLSDGGNDHNMAINGVGQAETGEQKNVDIFSEGPMANSEQSFDLPMPPPMPDFSNLPPPVPIPSSGIGAPVTAQELGVTPPPPPGLPEDPGQFKIPGQ